MNPQKFFFFLFLSLCLSTSATLAGFVCLLSLFFPLSFFNLFFLKHNLTHQNHFKNKTLQSQQNSNFFFLQ
ncbi:hypothetical protein ACJW30_05G013600 [Castanea mollissima]